MSSVQKVEFTPRPYQAEIAETAMNKNTIIFLPTGSGKTYIAVLVIKKFLSMENKPFRQGGKRFFFVVNTVVLVDQQASVLERHLPITKAGRYFGAMNVDNWSREQWISEFEKHETLVMTAEIFRMILAHGFISPEQIAVVIFDECHRAVGDSPMHEASRLIVKAKNGGWSPRMIGLTATLLNANAKDLGEVQRIVAELLKSFDAVLGCISDEGVRCFSTKPKEKIIPYSKVDDSSAALVTFKNIAERAMALSSVFATTRKFFKDSPLNDRLKKLKKEVKNVLADVLFQFDNLGVYGGHKAAHFAIKLFEHMKVGELNMLALLQLTHGVNAVTAMCGLLMTRMSPYLEAQRPYVCSSPKVQTLLKLLLKIRGEYEDDLSCLILVQRKMTAKMLCIVLKHISRLPDYSFIKPTFLVGNAGFPEPFPADSGDCERMNRQAVKLFESKDANVLVSTEVTEEGIDIPQCNCVVKFDKIVSYRSYMQSKGRARSSDSHYFILEKIEEVDQTYCKLREFGRIEDYLCNIVKNPDVEDMNAGDDQALEFFETKTATLRDLSAISVLNKFCSVFNYDQYTIETPHFKILIVDQFGERLSKGMGAVTPYFKAELKLPQSTSVSLTICSDVKGNSKLAKRNAAFKMCIKLYRQGLLNEDLIPVPPGSDFKPPSHWWPHWKITEQLERQMTKKGDRLGSKKISCLYFSRVPHCLTDCAPNPHRPSYLHIIDLRPKSSQPPPSRYSPVHKELIQNASYAILTTKKMPKVCSFPVFSKFTDMVVDVVPNYKELVLHEDQICQLQLFSDILFVHMTACVAFSEAHKKVGGKDYLVVPTKRESGDVSIDWKEVKNCVGLLDARKPSDETRLCLQVCNETYRGAVIKPWYRGGDLMYLVTEVSSYLNGYSLFLDTAETYVERFHREYEADSLRPDLPLLLTQPFSKSVNGLKRTRLMEPKSKRHGEHYLPDLVTKFPISGTLWIKGALMPTVLYRLERLLIAEELRSTLAAEAYLGYKNIPPGFEWQPLTEEMECAQTNQTAQNVSEVPVVTEMVVEKRDFLSEFWDPDADQDIQFLETYRDELTFMPDYSPERDYVYDDVPDVSVPFPRLLRSEGNPEGPQLTRIMAALTAPSANDIVNYERMETLGDSFLKVSVSLFLYEACPVKTEGLLTDLKSRFIGNRNLFCCALNKKLPEMMSVRGLNLPSDWCPPNFVVPPRKLVHEKKFEIDKKLSDLAVSFSNISLNQKPCFVPVKNKNQEKDHSDGTQNISDKVAADCVEALLGAALLDSGWDGALNVLVWLDLVPSKVFRRNGTTVSVKQLLKKGFYEPHSSQTVVISKEIETIQTIINYKFRDLKFLKWALTHPSYDAQNSYERLEFIGDSVLDFLITSYIYENCGLLTPGQLTDLRSALVNNVTFASLAAKYGLNRFMLINSPTLIQAIDAFIQFQKASNHKVASDVLVLCDEGEIKISDTITVPKALADVFEALAGAIFFDSGRDLNAVWKVFYPIMHSVIEDFSKDVPIDPVRKLYELYQDLSFDYNKDEVNGKMIATCKVILRDRVHVFHGYGDNKKMAKKSVAKFTVDALKNVPSS